MKIFVKKICKRRVQFKLVLIFFLLFTMVDCRSKSEPDPNPVTPPLSLGKVQVWMTKGDKSKLFSRETDINLSAVPSTSYPVVTLDTTILYQTVDGFGAALTGSSAYLIQNKLSDGARNTLLTKLFDTINGIGISFLRLTIGASDFSTSYYTYNDLAAGETDFTLEKFSLSYDTLDVIPSLKRILSISPKVRLLGSPWSPPAWMKTNGKLIGGKLKPECFAVYADYFVRYIQKMKESGIEIYAITPQNEPLYSTANYPCMEMTAPEQANFIRSYLGPGFQVASIKTKIIIYDHNWDNTTYPVSILNLYDVNMFVSGTAFHGYAGDVSAMGTVHQAFPDKGLYFTEISGGTWATNFGDNLMWNMRNIFIGTTTNWSKCALLWNLALDQNGAPHEGNSSTCRGVVTINSSSGALTFNEEYYSIAHFSKFVRPGARRISLTMPAAIPDFGAVAFINPDGTKTLVASNYSNTMTFFTVNQGQRNFSFSIPGKTVVTFVWN